MVDMKKCISKKLKNDILIFDVFFTKPMKTYISKKNAIFVCPKNKISTKHQ